MSEQKKRRKTSFALLLIVLDECMFYSDVLSTNRKKEKSGKSMMLNRS